MAWYANATIPARPYLDYIEREYGLDVVHEMYDEGTQGDRVDLTVAILFQLAEDHDITFPISKMCRRDRHVDCGLLECGCGCHVSEDCA